METEGASQAVIDVFQARREAHFHSNPLFLSCVGKVDHGAKNFLPMTRFGKSELTNAIRDMEDSPATSSNRENHSPADMAPSPISNDSEATIISNGDIMHVSGQPSSPSLKLCSIDS